MLLVQALEMSGMFLILGIFTWISEMGDLEVCHSSFIVENGNIEFLVPDRESMSNEVYPSYHQTVNNSVMLGWDFIFVVFF